MQIKQKDEVDFLRIGFTIQTESQHSPYINNFISTTVRLLDGHNLSLFILSPSEEAIRPCDRIMKSPVAGRREGGSLMRGAAGGKEEVRQERTEEEVACKERSAS